MTLDALVKAYDVRGIYPDEINEQVTHALGAAFADIIVLADWNRSADGAGEGTASAPREAGTERPAVVIGHDMRPSCPALVEAFARGLTDRGVDVVLIGLCSTDGLYHASGTLGLPGAMFTASHNPAEYNGIKLCRAGARPVAADTGLFAVRDLAARYLSDEVPVASTRGVTSQREMLGAYAQFLRSLVDLANLRPLRIVVDAGNGMAGLTTPAVLGTAAGLPALPGTLYDLYFELDGTFPNHEANPLDPKNLVDLQEAVRAHEADIGLAFDGDADRCFVVDETGALVSPSAITALVGLREMEREARVGRTATIIYNLITSRAVPELVAAAGGNPVVTRVGHSFIKAEMAAENAVFGGEHSAHYYFRDFFYADSGMLAALHVLAALGSSDLRLSDLAAMYTPYVSSGEINSRIADVPAAVDRVIQAYVTEAGAGPVTVDRMDGLTVSHWDTTPRWWFNLRASNTEPLLRLNVEAADEDIMEKVRDDVLALVRAGEGKEQ